METGDEKSKDESLPPGFRFHPSDEELITYYLANKISDPSFVCRAVADVDLNKCEPWDLPGKAKMRGKEWYFFSLRDRKYPTGVRTNRATSTGYWKTTGKDKEIYNKVSIELVGMKKTLVFYKGRAPRGEKTSWVMHEYRLHSTSAYRSAKDEWVVCRVFQKSVGIKKYPTTTPQQSSCSRSIINLEMGTNQLVLPLVPTQYPSMGQNYMVMNNLELVELSRALRNNGGSTSTTLPIHHPLDGAGAGAGAGAGDGGFTISSLNLNLGASQGPSLRPMMIQQGAIQDHVMTSSMLNGLEHGYDGSSLDMNVDNCVDQFDDSSYWPNY